MKNRMLLMLSLALSSCGSTERGTVVSHVPLTVHGVTYQWPVNSATLKSAGPPEQWKHSGYIPASIWNEVMSSVPSMRQTGWDGLITIPLPAAPTKEWNIQPDGAGIPFLEHMGHFELAEKGKGFTVGKLVGKEIAKPPVVVVFDREPQAFVLCSAPERTSEGSCDLMLNDRGVEHELPFRWGAWGEGKAALFYYRALVGIPQRV